jgi:hypothetical protein
VVDDPVAPVAEQPPAAADTASPRSEDPPPVVADAAPPRDQARAGSDASAPPWRVRSLTVRARRDGVVRLHLTCPAAVAGRCRTTLVLRDGRRVAGRSAPIALRPGTTAPVSVRLVRGARVALERRAVLRLAVTAEGRRVATLRVRRP